MHPVTLEQGTRLDDRYHLEQRVGGGEGCTLWRAVDQVLSRRVAVRTVEESSGLAESVLAAARASSVVGDPRLVRVLDASRTGGLVYVVTEWVDGVSLSRQLEVGPLDPGEAAYVVGEVAEAMESAYRAGLPHLCLSPHSVIRTRSGEVRVTGLGVAAALSGATANDPAHADAQGLGALLYAALTARWPHGARYGLEGAPTENGQPCTPRQIRAGIPKGIENVVQAALYDPPLNGVEPLSSPAAVSAVLARLPRSATRYDTLSLPMMPPAPDPSTAADGRSDRTESYGPPPPSTPAGWQTDPSDSRPGSGTVFLKRLLVTVITIAVLLGIWQVALELMRTGGPTSGGGSPDGTSREAGPKPGTVIEVVDVDDFDPYSDDGDEHPEEVSYAIDGRDDTAWETMNYYGRPDLAGLKPGVGLVLDLGDAQRIGSVTVQLEGSGTDLELRGAKTPGDTESDFTLLDEAAGAGETVTLRPGDKTQARYLLVWLTSLPPGDGGYRGGVTEITVRS